MIGSKSNHYSNRTNPKTRNEKKMRVSQRNDCLTLEILDIYYCDM